MQTRKKQGDPRRGDPPESFRRVPASWPQAVWTMRHRNPLLPRPLPQREARPVRLLQEVGLRLLAFRGNCHSVPTAGSVSPGDVCSGRNEEASVPSAPAAPSPQRAWEPRRGADAAI